MDWKFLDENYKVSEFGDVFSVRRNKFLNPSTLPKGYKQIKLYSKSVFIHRLVGELFLDNPNNFPIILHKDSDPSNNHYSNLIWGTYKENSDQCVREGKHKGRKMFVVISPKGETFTTYNLSQFSKDNNLILNNLWLLCNGRIKQHKGWTSPVCKTNY